MSSDPALPKLPANRISGFTAVFLLSLASDLWSKSAAFAGYGLHNGSGWLIDQPWIQFRLFTNLNEGALWGMGQGFALGFAALSVVAFAGIIFWLFVRKAAHSLWLTICLALVAGGTIGNLYDRLALHGITPPGTSKPIHAVRDFLHFRFGTFDWAIFNIADVCLVVGAIMLMLHSLFLQEDEAKEAIATPS